MFHGDTRAGISNTQISVAETRVTRVHQVIHFMWWLGGRENSSGEFKVLALSYSERYRALVCRISSRLECADEDI